MSEAPEEEKLAFGHQKAGSLSNQQLRTHAKAISIGVMITAFFAALAYVRAFLIARHRLAMEAAALR
jgi:putative transposase